MKQEKFLNLILYAPSIMHALKLAIFLKLFDIINSDSYSTGEIAKKISANKIATERFLIFFSNIGFIKKKRTKWYLTKFGNKFFISNKERLSEYLLLTSKEIYMSCEHIKYSLLTGKPSFERLYNYNFFDYLKQSSRSFEVYHSGWSKVTREVAKALIEKYNFVSVKTVTDLGGGTGSLLAEVLKKHQSLEGVIVDKHYLKEKVLLYMKEQNLKDQYKFVDVNSYLKGNFKTDVIIMKSFLHLFNDETVLKLLRDCYKKLKYKGKVLIIERDYQKNKLLNRGVFTDMTMLLVTGGKERDKQEIQNLLNQGGIKLISALSLPHDFIMYEGIKNEKISK